MTNLFKGIILTLFISVTGFLFAGCDDVPLQAIQIEGLPTDTIVTGQTFELHAVFDPINATDQRVQWWTPTNDIIKMETISETIVSIETLNTGSAIVYVRAYDGNFTASVTINVSAGTLNLRFQGSVNGVVTRDYNGEPQQMQVVGVSEDITYLYRLQGETEYTTEAPINVGAYDIRAEVHSDNYVGSCEGTLNILPQEIQVQANNREISYGAEDIALTYRVVGNFYDNTLTVSGSLLREQGVNVGNYRIFENEAFTLTGDNCENYKLTFVEGNYCISAAVATAQVNAPATYYGVAPGGITYTVSGLQNGDTEEDLNISIAVPDNAHDVGLYELICQYNNSNYNLTFLNNWITIVRTQVTLVVGSDEKKYKTDDPEDYTYTIYNSRNTQDTSSLFYDDVLTVSFSRAEGEDVGQYDINAEVSGVCVSNYNVVIVAGTLTINPRIVTVQASDATKRYGQADPDFSYSFQSDSDEIIDDELTFSIERQTGEDVGDYDIVPVGNQTKENYQVSVINGSLTIQQATIIIDVHSKTFKYGEELVFTYNLNENSDDIINDELIITLSGADTNVGTYNITCECIEANDKSNYNVTINGAQYEITKRNYIIQLGDLEKYEGEQDPAASEYTKQVDSTSDSILDEDWEIIANMLENLEITRDEGETSGKYRVYGSAEDGEHYTVTILSGTLTILENTSSDE